MTDSEQQAIADFLFVINVNFCFIKYRLRVIRDFSDFVYETRCDITTIYPPGGVTSQIK